MALGVVVANIAVSEQIGEMMVHCKYGCKLSDDGQTHVKDPTTCPVMIKMSNRRYGYTHLSVLIHAEKLASACLN